MTGESESAPDRGTGLLDPRFLVALVLLVVNDRILKGLWPGLVTGKLSDFAGMVVGPVVLAGLLGVARVPLRTRIAMSIGVSGAYLAAINVSPNIAGLAERSLESLTGVPQHIVVDPTDLAGLVGLFVAVRVLHEPIVVDVSLWARRALLATGIAASLATSADEPTVYRDISVADDQTVELVGSSPWQDDTIQVRTSTDGGRTWSWGDSQPSRPQETVSELCLAPPSTTCIRIGPEAEIYERTETDASWMQVWRLDNKASWVNKFSSGGSGIFPEVRAFDMVELADGTVVVAMGELDPIRRTAEGEWTPSISGLRQMPWLGVTLAAVASFFLTVGSALWFGKMRGEKVRLFGGLSGVAMVPLLFGILMTATNWGDFNPLNALFLAFVALPLAVLAALICIVACVRARRSGHAEQQQAIVAVMATAAVGAAAIPATFGLWANDLAGWNFALWCASAAPFVSTAIAWSIARRGADRSPLSPPDQALDLFPGQA